MEAPGMLHGDRRFSTMEILMINTTQPFILIRFLHGDSVADDNLRSPTNVIGTSLCMAATQGFVSVVILSYLNFGGLCSATFSYIF